MKKNSFAKGICAIGLAAVCACGLAACSSTSSESSSADLTGGVAATVNGTEISEDTITQAIESARDNYYYYYYYYLGTDLTEGKSNDEIWADYLETSGSTPEELREEYIDKYIDDELLLQYAGERGVDVSSETVDSYVDEMKSNYSSDEEWQNALERLGITENDYKDSIKLDLISEEVHDSFAVDDESDEVTDEELLTYAQENAKEKYDGAKRSSHILFNSEDEELAQEVLDKIKADELDFAEAAEEYSIDTASSLEGGDVGWDKVVSFVDEYQEALDELSKGQVSNLVESEYGYHIIKCTDVFYVPDNITSISDWPEEIVEDMTEAVEEENEDAKEAEQDDAYDAWLEECRDKATIVINDMPENVPYNVDVTQYEDEEASAADTAADSDDSEATDEETSSSDADSSASDAEEATEDSSSSSSSSSSSESSSSESSSSESSSSSASSSESSSDSSSSSSDNNSSSSDSTSNASDSSASSAASNN